MKTIRIPFQLYCRNGTAWTRERQQRMLICQNWATRLGASEPGDYTLIARPVKTWRGKHVFEVNPTHVRPLNTKDTYWGMLLMYAMSDIITLRFAGRKRKQKFSVRVVKELA